MLSVRSNDPVLNKPPSGTPANGKDYGDVRRIVNGIGCGDASAMEDFQTILLAGTRWTLARTIGVEESEEKAREIFLMVIEAIRLGKLREPERLMGYVKTIASRMVFAYIEARTEARMCILDTADIHITDGAENPEQAVIRKEKIELMKRVLRELPERDRDILVRFYLQEQTQQEICKEMNLTENQFRLLKWKAKARFGELGCKKLNPRNCQAYQEVVRFPGAAKPRDSDGHRYGRGDTRAAANSITTPEWANGTFTTK